MLEFKIEELKLENLEEAKQYLENKYLYKNLMLICNELLKIENKDIIDIMGNIDSLKLCSSMTLFHIIDPNEKVFIEIIEKYYTNIQDEKTISIIKNFKKNEELIQNVNIFR